MSLTSTELNSTARVLAAADKQNTNDLNSAELWEEQVLENNA